MILLVDRARSRSVATTMVWRAVRRSRHGWLGDLATSGIVMELGAGVSVF